MIVFYRQGHDVSFIAYFRLWEHISCDAYSLIYKSRFRKEYLDTNILYELL